MDDMVMPRHIMRTRFLEQLDEMLRQDRRGAIDDMLQVLRERGVLRTASASVVVSDYEVENYGDDFVEYTKRNVGDMVGAFLHSEGRITHSAKRESHDTTRMIGEITVVVGW